MIVSLPLFLISPRKPLRESFHQELTRAEAKVESCTTKEYICCVSFVSVELDDYDLIAKVRAPGQISAHKWIVGSTSN